MKNNNAMDSFIFSWDESNWPLWFYQYIKEEKVVISSKPDDTIYDEDDWEFWQDYTAYLWTPNKIVSVEEAERIVNQGTYCTSEKEVVEHE